MLLTECDWDYVKKLYEYDMEQLQADNVQLHSAIEQLHSDNVQLHSYSEQLQFDKEQFRSYTEQLLHMQLQNCKQIGSSKSDAITLIQKQIPSLSDQLITEVADAVFDS